MRRSSYWLGFAAGFAALSLLLTDAVPSGSQSRAGDEGDGSYETSVIARDLDQPVGITVGRLVHHRALFFTQVPTPGVPGSMGGRNGVRSLTRDGIGIINDGEPEPTNIVQDRNGTLFWTCKSAGVILAQLEDGTTFPLAGGLSQPSGIAVAPQGDVIYWTELPTPGVPGSMGGRNRVLKGVLSTGEITEIDFGDPEPVDIAAASNGDLFWTCKSAGVIVKYDAAKATKAVILRGLDQPVGIALDARERLLYWTEVPTPGVPGSMGGRNRVAVLNLETSRTRLVDEGDPEPTDIAVGREGTIFWTCTSAGVIVRAQFVR